MNDDAPLPLSIHQESEPKGLGTTSQHEVHSQGIPTVPTDTKEQPEHPGIGRETSRRSLFRRALSRRPSLRPTKSLGSEDFNKLIGDAESLQSWSHSCDNLVVDISDESFGAKELGDTADSSPEKKTDRSAKSKSSTRRALKVLKKVSKSTRNILGKPSTSVASRGENAVDDLNNSSIHSLGSRRQSEDVKEQNQSDGKSLLAKSLDRWGSSSGPGKVQSKRGTLKRTPSSRRGLFSSKQPVQGNESISDMSSFSLFSTQSDDKYCALDGSMSSFAQDSNSSLLCEEVKETVGEESHFAPAQFRIDTPSASCLSLSDEEMTIHEIKVDPGEGDDSHSNRRHHSAPTLLEHHGRWEMEVPTYLSETEDISIHSSTEKTEHDDDDVSTTSVLTKGNVPGESFSGIKYYLSPEQDDKSKVLRSRQQTSSTPEVGEISSNTRRSKANRTKSTQRNAADATSLHEERSRSQRTAAEPDAPPSQEERSNSAGQSSRNGPTSKSDSVSKSKSRSDLKRTSSKNKSCSKSSSSSKSRASSKSRQAKACSKTIECADGKSHRRRPSVKDERSQSRRRDRTSGLDDSQSCDDSDGDSSVRRRRRSKPKDLDDDIPHRSKPRSSSRRCDCDPPRGYALPTDYRVKEDSVRRTKSDGLLSRKLY